jgi:DNA (cytosine-5)-methyltransferase 1
MNYSTDVNFLQNGSELHLTAVDLFCGSGAVSSALAGKGVRVIAAVDNDEIACDTYAANHPEVELVCGDIRKINPNLHPVFSAVEKINILIVCAPCQPFSSQNKKRGSQDVRSLLIFESIKFIKSLRPDCVFFENVPGLANVNDNELIPKLAKELKSIGYNLSPPRKIDAQHLGVPQRRIRCVMVATRSEKSSLIFSKYEFPRELTTVRQAIGHLIPIKSGERYVPDSLHYARKHSPLVLKRLASISANGGSRSELPANLQLACHVDRKNSYSDVYGRMLWDSVAPTLTTGCTDVTRGRFAHPDQDRAITLREAALLQTFPPSYVFKGNASEIARQIGNAVPVKMVEAILPVLRRIVSQELLAL